jgi:hypothetical protein
MMWDVDDLFWSCLFGVREGERKKEVEDCEVKKME